MYTEDLKKAVTDNKGRYLKLIKCDYLVIEFLDTTKARISTFGVAINAYMKASKFEISRDTWGKFYLNIDYNGMMITPESIDRIEFTDNFA